MTRIGVLALAAAVSMSGCLVTDDSDCGGGVWRFPTRRSTLADGPNRNTYRVLMTITEEGSASEAGQALRSSGTLWLTEWANFDILPVPEHVGIGFSRADGSGETYVNRLELVVEDPLGDCGEGTCSREFRAWLDSVGPGVVGLDGELRVPDRICGSFEERSRWLAIEFEPIE